MASSSSSKDPIDLPSLSKFKPFTVDDLRRFGAADVNPYTVQLGQVLCEHRGWINFSQQGHRNLAAAFDSLPAKDWSEGNFEIGYGEHHCLHTVLKTDEGMCLAAMVGALAEWFCEDVVVEFWVVVMKRSGVPSAWECLEEQWRRLVGVLCGVLSTSTLGTLLGIVEEKLPAPVGSVSVERLLVAVDGMSELAKSRGKTIRLQAGAELVWVVAVAQWLFDLKVGVVSEAANLIYTSSGVTTVEQAEVVFELVAESLTSAFHSFSLSDTPAGRQAVISGGRVPYETLFRSTFGQHFVALGDETIAAYICSASAIFRHTTDPAESGPTQNFLQRSDTNSTGALLDTLTAWFPELRRLTSRFAKYTKLNFDDSKKMFDKTYEELLRQCTCSQCLSGPETAADETCSIVLAEFIVSFGLRIVKRMVVTSKLFPKKGGVLELYKRHEASRPPKPANITPSDHFIQIMATKPAGLVEMLRAATLLFANSISKEIERQKDLMGITHHGMCVFVTGFKEVVMADNSSPKTEVWTTTVQVMPGWMCLFGHEAQMEVFEKTQQEIDFEGQWRYANSGIMYVQIMKRKGRTMLTSGVEEGGEEEKRRLSEGWERMSSYKNNEAITQSGIATIK